ncbi:MAG: cyclic nucleotide-binding/CBS domain-containing protein [Halodesulfurarchaeum sp.]
MDDIFVGRIMSSPVVTVSSDASVREAARRMRENDIGSLVVVDDGERLRGILTATDFVSAVGDDRSMAEMTVADCMTEVVATTTANEPIRDVADVMTEHGFHHVPVVDDERVIGMVTTSDLTAYLSHVEVPSPS